MGTHNTYTSWHKCSNCKTKFPIEKKYGSKLHPTTMCSYCGVEGVNEVIGADKDLVEGKKPGKQILHD